MQTVLPILMILGGVFATLGIWMPRFRTRWSCTQITCGPVSCAGFGLSFIGIGILFLIEDAAPEPFVILFGFVFIVGWITGALGYGIDRRAFVRNLQEASTPPEPNPEKAPEEIS